MSVRVVLLVVSAPFASALLPALALPAAPVIAGAAASLLAFTGVRRAQRNEKAFFSMDWSQEVPDTDDACAIIGEETVENGKIWMVCNEKSADADTECSPVTGGNPDSDEDQWLCKVPKP